MDDSLLDDVQIKKLRRGWECIITQYFDLACDNAMKEGKGISIFRFLKKNEGDSNCHYFYSKSDTNTWNTIVNSSLYSKKLLEKYDSNSMIMICVQVPVGNSISGDETNGNIKIFSIDTKKEILLENSDDDDKKEVVLKNEGLRKRNALPS